MVFEIVQSVYRQWQSAFKFHRTDSLSLVRHYSLLLVLPACPGFGLKSNKVVTSGPRESLQPLFRLMELDLWRLYLHRVPWHTVSSNAIQTWIVVPKPIFTNYCNYSSQLRWVILCWNKKRIFHVPVFLQTTHIPMIPTQVSYKLEIN